MKRLPVVGFTIVMLAWIAAACGPTVGGVEPVVGAQPTPVVTVNNSNSNAEEIQTIQLDNCEGKGDSKRTEVRSQSIEAEISAGLAAQIGANAGVVQGAVQVAVGTALTAGSERSSSIELSAPPGTHMEIQLVWMGEEQVGVVQNILGSDVPIAFRSFSPTDVRIKSQYDIGCPTPSSATEQVPSPPPITTEASTREGQCIRPEALAEERNWTGLEMVDEYGGYRVQLNQPDELPPSWEANGARLITQLDSDRAMAAGIWIIYVPYNCRHIIDIQEPQCVRPEELARQMGWIGQGIVDQYCGYQITLAQQANLPELWEANGAKQIRQLDTDRTMSPGVWTIYTPYSCREALGCEK